MMIIKWPLVFFDHVNNFVTLAIPMTPPARAIRMAILCLAMNFTAQAQLTEREGEGNQQDEITRIEDKMRDIIQQGENLKLGHANPREIFAYCKETLPKLEELFRVQMRRISPELQLGLRRYYMENRQSLLNLLVTAQLALGQSTR
jgi:hypothetical protein